MPVRSKRGLGEDAQKGKQVATRYTAVFEFPAGMEPPSVGAMNDWLGGKLCAVQFTDALRENERLHNQVAVAKAIVKAGVDLMHHTQLGQWAGVRSFLEQEADDYEPFEPPNAFSGT